MLSCLILLSSIKRHSFSHVFFGFFAPLTEVRLNIFKEFMFFIRANHCITFFLHILYERLDLWNRWSLWYFQPRKSSPPFLTIFCLSYFNYWLVFYLLQRLIPFSSFTYLTRIIFYWLSVFFYNNCRVFCY